MSVNYPASLGQKIEEHFKECQGILGALSCGAQELPDVIEEVVSHLELYALTAESVLMARPGHPQHNSDAFKLAQWIVDARRLNDQVKGYLRLSAPESNIRKIVVP